VFAKGSKTPVFVRFSTVIHGQHSPETLRDPRGFATKFYTSEGNWDLVGNNLPVFFIRDAIKFPDMVHSLKPAPDTNLQDPNRFFDFFSHQPEATHMLTRLYSDYGIPKGYQYMDGNSVHAWKLVNAQGKYVYVKFHWASRQGQHNLTMQQAAAIQAQGFQPCQPQPDGGHQAQAISAVGSVHPGDAAGGHGEARLQPAGCDQDLAGIPEQKIGTMTLNRNPANIFQETEQSAFAPSNLVPGIEPSEDRLLQGRIFAYADTQLHRVGTNGQQLPINRPHVPWKQ
jgi:catalase